MIPIKEPTILLRALNSTGTKCLVALLMSSEPLTFTRLAHLTQSSRNSVSAAMEVLSDLGFADRIATRKGWVLTPEAEELLFAPRFQGEEALPAGYGGDSLPLRESDPPEDRAESAIEDQGGGGINLKSLINNPSPPDSSLEHDRPPVAREQDFSGREDVHPGAPPADQAHLTRVKAILEATPLLFGESLHGPPSRYPDLIALLAWIADCYTRRGSLRKPARVAYSNLKNGLTPPERYRRDPLRHLPTRFLEKAGLPLPRERLEGQLGEGGQECNETPVPLDPASSPRHASLDAPLDSAGGRTPAQIWEQVLHTLREDMSPGLYQRWVRPLCLRRYDAPAGTFLAVAPDERSRLWLHDHLKSTLEKRLRGLCGPETGVDFLPPKSLED